MYRSEHEAALARAVAAFETACGDDADDLRPHEERSTAELTALAEELEQRHPVRRETTGRSCLPHDDARREHAAALSDWFTAKRKVTARAKELASLAARDGREFSLEALIGRKPSGSREANAGQFKLATAVLRHHVRQMQEALATLPSSPVTNPRNTRARRTIAPVTTAPFGVLVPFRSYAIESGLSVAEAQAALRALVSSPRARGRERHDDFKFSPTNWYHDPFAPVVCVRVAAAGNGSRIAVRMRLGILSATIIAVWMGLATIAGSAGLVALLVGHATGLVGLALPVAGAWFCGGSFAIAARKVEPMLREVLPPQQVDE